ncbi:MAG: kelch repeat-containing protein [Planctomycetota bacterium]
MTISIPRSEFWTAAGRVLLGIAAFSAIGSRISAHMPWLASDDDGHAVMWFGESPNDRAYHMPESIAAIELRQTSEDAAIETVGVDDDDSIGVRTAEAIQSDEEISGVVTYGLYHGMKLTYHVEHLPHSDASQWPTKARPGALLQTVIAAGPDGGVLVTVLHEGKPAKDVEVKLFCEDGHVEATKTTDSIGLVSFEGDVVEPGLNAVMLGITQSDAAGDLDGESYKSTADYLTSTFVKTSAHRQDSQRNAKSNDASKPTVVSNSGVRIVPSGLPELPEELTSFGAAICDGKLFVYGGHTGSAHSYSKEEQSDRLWSLDLSEGKDGQWRQLAGGPTLQGLALVAHGDSLVRIGGFTARNEIGDDHDLHSQATVVRYDIAEDRWSELPPLPETRSSLDAAVLGDTVYVFGGWSMAGEEDTVWHQTAWSLDLAADDAQWLPLATPDFKRRALSVAAHDGKLFVIGGMRDQGGPTTRVDVYDVETEQWHEGPSLPGGGMAGFGTSSFACGGSLFVSTMDGFVHRLNADGNEWASVAKCDPARFFHRMLPVSDQELLLIGGANMAIGKFTEIDSIRIDKVATSLSQVAN